MKNLDGFPYIPESSQCIAFGAPSVGLPLSGFMGLISNVDQQE